MSGPTLLTLFALFLAPHVHAVKLKRDFLLDTPDILDLEKGTTVIEYEMPPGFNSSNTIRVHTRFLPGATTADFEVVTFVAVYGETSLEYKISNETRSGSCTLCFTEVPEYEYLSLIASTKEAVKVELTLKHESIKLRLSDRDEPAMKTNVTATVNNPVTFLVDPASDVDAERNDRYLLLVKDVGGINSADVCIIVGAYSNSCPFKDNPERIRNSEIWFTMLERGAMTIRSETHNFNSPFYISLMVTDDASCRLPDVNYTRSANGTKEISVSIARMKPYESYMEPIIVAAFVCLLLALMAIVIMRLKTYGKEHAGPANENAKEGNGEVTLATQNDASVEGGTGGADVTDGNPDEPQSMQPMLNDDPDDIKHLKELCIEALPKDSTRKDRVTKGVKRLNKKAMLSDMTEILKDDPWFRRNRSRIYCYLVPLLSLFYAIPSLQYVFLVKKSENMTGTLDLCFHNFECSKPFNVFSDFNHVVSNLSYLIFGLAFIACVAIKSHRLPKNQNTKTDHLSETGILQQLSIFYAMGFALVFQGLFSVCYHVCPTNHSLQFDSTMMYVMLMLGCVKIYQFRHPDANANAYSFFYTLAAILMAEALTLYTSSWSIYILFIFFYIGMTIFIAVDCYYVGIGRLHHKIGWVLAKEVLGFLKKPCSPRYRQRFFFSVLFIVVNVLHAGTLHTSRGLFNFPLIYWLLQSFRSTIKTANLTRR